jgi:hypothetical protein
MLKILNASPGFGAPLNEQETVDFLTIGKLNIHRLAMMEDRIFLAQNMETTILIELF